MEQANEVQESLGRSYGVPDEVDEEDLQAGMLNPACLQRRHSTAFFRMLIFSRTRRSGHGRRYHRRGGDTFLPPGRTSPSRLRRQRTGGGGPRELLSYMHSSQANAPPHIGKEWPHCRSGEMIERSSRPSTWGSFESCWTSRWTSGKGGF